jgi:hypothetical protein
MFVRELDLAKLGHGESRPTFLTCLTRYYFETRDGVFRVVTKIQVLDT